LFVAAGLIAFAALIVFGAANASPSGAKGQAQSTAQSQNAAAGAPAYVFEVISVKPSNPASRRGTMNTPDGYDATNIEPIIFIDSAYGILHPEQLAGAPGWVTSEKYDIDARMESSVADALQKLSPDERKLARQHMLQALLADRFKLIVHRETRELSIYSLVIGKNGPKLKEAKPDDNSPDRIKRADGRAATDMVNMQASQAGSTWTGQAVSMPFLIQLLSRQVGRIVIDKTGLKGAFDFTMQFMPEQGGPQMAPAGATGGASPLPASDPGAPSIFTAIQEGLGLKLEAGKAPIEVILIDHIERPSGN
jgi:uncharacterized protein (TIGR03435 family)